MYLKEIGQEIGEQVINIYQSQPRRSNQDNGDAYIESILKGSIAYSPVRYDTIRESFTISIFFLAHIPISYGLDPFDKIWIL